MTAERFVLLCAPAGCGFDWACTVLKDRLVDTVGETSVRLVDVEKVLCAEVGAREALRGSVAEQQEITMHDVTYNLTKRTVIRLWRAALKDAIHRVSAPPAPRLRLVACHLNLYNARRQEFYSPVEVGPLKDAGVDRVILFIDDVFDMYVRLTDGRLYHESEDATAYVTAAMDERRAGPSLPGEGDELTEATQRDLRLEWKLTVLGRLVAWRHAEMIRAESLASELGARYSVIGTKHSCDVARVWIEGQHANSAYVSHPISGPRRESRSTGTWPPVVDEVNALQELFVSRGIATIMPTAIDEYRIAREDEASGPRGELAALRPYLDPRWPLPMTDQGGPTLFYRRPDGTRGAPAPDYPELMVENGAGSSAYWSPSLRLVEAQVKAEVAFRDHHLVACNSGLVVYRPCYEVGRASRGVTAEVSHWLELYEDEATRRAAFIHCIADVSTVIARQRRTGEGDDLIENMLIRILLGDFQLAAREAGEQAAAILQTRNKAGHLDQGVDRAQFREMRDELILRAKVDAIGVDLCAGRTDVLESAGVGVWILEDAADLESEIPQVVLFLSGTVTRPSAWRDRCARLLDELP